MDDDPLLGLGLNPVQLSDQALFDSYFRSLSQPLSDYSFSQVFTWGNSLRILWKEIRGHLCIFANGTGDLTLLVPPLGQSGSDRALAEAWEVMDAYNAAHDALDQGRAEYVSAELLSRFDMARFTVLPMGADYVYDVRRMIDLAGGDLASKRQLKNRFLRNYECRVESYVPAQHLESCQQLLQLWKHQQDINHGGDQAINSVKRQKESLACDMALQHAVPLGLKGMVVYVRPREESGPREWSLRGFTLGHALGSDQSSIVVEKTDLGVKGLAQFIFSEFCRACWADRPLVNAGDDWGLETLAWTKMSYRPAKLIEKYELRRVRPPAVSLAVSGCTEAKAPEADVACPAQPLVAMPCQAVGADFVDAEAQVRPARREDLAAAVDLEETCFSAYCLTKRQLRYLQGRSSAVFVVAEDRGRIVGEGISLVRKHRKGLSGRIYSLAVASEYRGRKIGQKLLERMIENLSARGVKRIYLEVEQSNTSAIRLYERNGFRTVNVLPDYYGAGKPGLHMMRPVGAVP